MREIRCRKCRRAWSMQDLHDIADRHNAAHPQDGLGVSEVYENFARYGCRVITHGDCDAVEAARQRAMDEWTWPTKEES